MAKDKEEEIKVIDRRHSARDDEDENRAPARGEGFVMKEGDKKTASAPQEIDFATFVFSLATGALINMGLAPDPNTGKQEKNLDLAKQNIDLLALMKEKTRGNLSEEESQLLDSLLTEVRLRFVDAKK